MCAITYATIAALPKARSRYDCEMDELLHLYSPRAVDMPEDGFDDTDRSMRRFDPLLAQRRHIKMAPGSRMSGKARQAVAADLRGIWAASGPGQVVIEGERTRGGRYSACVNDPRQTGFAA